MSAPPGTGKAANAQAELKRQQMSLGRRFDATDALLSSFEELLESSSKLSSFPQCKPRAPRPETPQEEEEQPEQQPPAPAPMSPRPPPPRAEAPARQLPVRRPSVVSLGFCEQNGTRPASPCTSRLASESRKSYSGSRPDQAPPSPFSLAPHRLGNQPRVSFQMSAPSPELSAGKVSLRRASTLTTLNSVPVGKGALLPDNGDGLFSECTPPVRYRARSGELQTGGGDGDVGLLTQYCVSPPDSPRVGAFRYSSGLASSGELDSPRAARAPRNSGGLAPSGEPDRAALQSPRLQTRSSGVQPRNLQLFSSCGTPTSTSAGNELRLAGHAPDSPRAGGSGRLSNGSLLGSPRALSLSGRLSMGPHQLSNNASGTASGSPPKSISCGHTLPTSSSQPLVPTQTKLDSAFSAPKQDSIPSAAKQDSAFSAGKPRRAPSRAVTFSSGPRPSSSSQGSTGPLVPTCRQKTAGVAVVSSEPTDSKRVSFADASGPLPIFRSKSSGLLQSILTGTLGDTSAQTSARASTDGAAMVDGACRGPGSFTAPESVAMGVLCWTPRPLLGR